MLTAPLHHHAEGQATHPSFMANNPPDWPSQVSSICIILLVWSTFCNSFYNKARPDDWQLLLCYRFIFANHMLCLCLPYLNG